MLKSPLRLTPCETRPSDVAPHVVLHRNPFDKLAPLGSFDWQIQDEAM